jgi:N-glycosidase YbiA
MSRAIYFYAKDELFGEFSNFALFGIEMDGKWWPTVEHYFQAQKFLDADYQEKIRKTHAAKEAANLGRSRKLPIRGDWEFVKEQIMFDAVLKKFSKHEKLKHLLLETADNEIIENSPNDHFWGGGQDGAGQNKLGKILMRVRDQLKII